MSERSELALKILCWAMAALVVYRLVLVLAHINPLYHLAIPALPSLPSVATTTATGTTTNSGGAMKQTTNSVRQASTTGSTNNPTRTTNVVARSTNQVLTATNALARATNSVSHGSNVVMQATNAIFHSTSSIAQTTNSVPNLPGSGGPMHRPPEFGRMGMPGGPMPGMAKPGPELPPEMQARIDRVIESEILAPVMRPLPMALLGIAGNDVFLRAPNGQTGLIKEGEELGGVKLVRIGINRVLVEEQGERKELTIFAGLGGESLLSTQKDSPK
jgi:hypothetical protein